jgi:hypothetical protein
MKNDPGYRLGFTWDWMEGVNDTATGWNEYGSPEYKFSLPPADTGDDWTQYDTIIVVPSNLVTSVALRARSYADFVGEAYFDDMLFASLPQTITGIKGENPLALNGIPTKYGINQNYPNPFNPTTIISYQVPEKALVILRVYNILGQNVATLFEGERGPGSYIATFDGSRFASGVYFYTLQSGKTLLAKKMLLVK